MPVVADQKPTTGTRAITDGVWIRVGVGALVGFGLGVGAGGGVGEAAVVGCDTDVGDGGVGAQDPTVAASVNAVNHRRAIRDACMAQA
jgi:uncharacterized membrane protein